MDFSFIPSLKYAALGKIIITLWNQEDIRDFIETINHEFPNDFDIKVTIEKVIEKIPRFSLPKSLERELIYLAKPIGLQILTWRRFHANFLPKEFVKASLSELCWTQLGIVDRKRTAEVLVRNENTDIIIRYKLACMYCLDHDIPVLWDKIPQYLRDDFYNENHPTDIEQEHLVVFWTYSVSGKLAKLIQAMKSKYEFQYNPYEYIFRKAIQSGNITAAKYFLHKMTPGNRNAVLLESSGFAVLAHAGATPFPDVCGTPGEHYSHLLYFLFSQMTEKQQAEMLEKYFCGILQCFLDWPFHNIFMRIANSVWTYMSEEVYYNLLCAIVRKVIDGPEYFNYRRLYDELWAQGQNAHIKYVINRSLSTCELLLNLILADDESNILLILKDVTIQEKQDFIFSGIGKDVHKALVSGNRWEMLQLFSRECIPSESIRHRFRKEFYLHIFDGPEGILVKLDVWDKFSRNFLL